MEDRSIGPLSEHIGNVRPTLRNGALHVVDLTKV